MNDFNPGQFSGAVNDFREARRKAAMQSVFSLFTGQSVDLLSFDEVSKMMKLIGPGRHYLDEIPLDAIIGSVGRYEDFNRKFLPRFDEDVTRWAHVKVAFEEKGLPPIEVYQIGEAYFVLDGNHRVSIARELDTITIEAYVTEFRTRVELSPDDDLDDILLKAEYVEFLIDTNLDKIRPDYDFQVTVPGRYHQIFEHISVHQYYLGIEQDQSVPWEEAAASWVDRVYSPLVRSFYRHGVLRDFPGRTETDLYLWLKKHHAELSEELGWTIEEEQVVKTFARQFSARPRRVFARIQKFIMDRLLPAVLESGPPVGAWRLIDQTPRDDQRMFASILVGVGHSEESWTALSQAFPVARHEGAVVRGLYVVPENAGLENKETDKIREVFNSRCNEAGIVGEFLVDVGRPNERIIERAAWNDLVMVHLSYPPGVGPIARLRSGFRSLVQRCPRPVIAVPAKADKLENILLGYDGSPKSDEALFLSAYLALSWNVSLTVIGSTASEKARQRTEQRVKSYLEEQNITATYVSRLGNPGEIMLLVAKEFDVDLIVMGGYEGNPIFNILFGSTVDQILRGFSKPVLVCR